MVFHYMTMSPFIHPFPRWWALQFFPITMVPRPFLYLFFLIYLYKSFSRRYPGRGIAGLEGCAHLLFACFLTQSGCTISLLYVTWYCYTFHFWQSDRCGMVSHFQWVKYLFILSSELPTHILLHIFFSVRLFVFFILICIIVSWSDFFI